ncbi:MAG: hypothetical protein ACFB9N_18865 [Geitlerinemataceae cyanobacterium]
MFTTAIAEKVFTLAWESGHICRRDWVMLTSEMVDEGALDIAARLMHAIRRGHLTVID